MISKGIEPSTISIHAPKEHQNISKQDRRTLKWNSDHLSLWPPLAFNFNELFSVKFQQPIYSIINFGKGKKRELIISSFCF